jgi:protein involved in polysaccharide export with SLBB domain
MNQRSIMLIMSGLAFILCALATPAAEPSAKPAGTNDTYRIGAGDLLELKVYREEDLDAKVIVNPDGVVRLQLVGAVKVAGMTLSEASQLVHDLYAKDYLVNPHIVLDLVETNKLPASMVTNVASKYIVLGQVNKPGTFEMREGEAINLLHAIALAGGYTRLGAPSKITVTRIENGAPRQIKLDADAMLRQKAKPFEIQPDDIVTVGEKLF